MSTEQEMPQRQTEAEFLAYLNQPDVGPWDQIDSTTDAYGCQTGEHHYWAVERTKTSNGEYAYEFIIHNGGDRETFFEHLRTGDYEEWDAELAAIHDWSYEQYESHFTSHYNEIEDDD